MPRAIREILVLLTVVAALGCTESNEAERSDRRKRPVVVVITLDTTRADHLGCYGYTRHPTSPSIDALAGEAALFTHAIAQAAVTTVSHASIFTGLNPYNHGVRVLHGVQNRLDESHVTLAEILRDDGYETGAFVSAFPVTEYFGFEQGFDHFDAEFAPADVARTHIEDGRVNTDFVQRTAGDTTRSAIDWIEQREGPFLLWLHYFDPHDDFLMPPPYLMRQVRFSDAERPRRKALYDLEIRYMDGMIGFVFDKLKELGLWDDSIVVLTADHGEGLGDHDWWTHGVLYQEQIRVPLIVKAPGIAGGTTLDSVVRTIDIVPTLGDLLGLSEDDLPSMDGVSLVPLLAGETSDLGLVAYSDSVNRLVYRTSDEIKDRKMDMLFALVIDGRFKYIHHLEETDKSELYDLREDPRELVNLYGERPDIVERALTELEALPFTPPEQLEIGSEPPEVVEQLKALGYVGSEAD